jgi:hypothetical protein
MPVPKKEKARGSCVRKPKAPPLLSVERLDDPNSETGKQRTRLVAKLPPKHLRQLILAEIKCFNDEDLEALCKAAVSTIGVLRGPTEKRRDSDSSYEAGQRQDLKHAERWASVWGRLAGKPIKPLRGLESHLQSLTFVFLWRIVAPADIAATREAPSADASKLLDNGQHLFTISQGTLGEEYRRRKEALFRGIELSFKKMEERAASKIGRNTERFRAPKQAEYLAAYLLHLRGQSPTRIAATIWPAARTLQKTQTRLRRECVESAGIRRHRLQDDLDEVTRLVDTERKRATRAIRAAKKLVSGWSGIVPVVEMRGRAKR